MKHRRTERGILHERWAKNVRKRDKYQCQACLAKNRMLHSHHIEGWANNPQKRYLLSNGITLCKNCHDEYHNVYGKSMFTKQSLVDFVNQKRSLRNIK